MKSISENKLKAFSIGRMNVAKTSLTKQDKAEQRKKEEEKKTAEVYKDFVASFEGGGKANVKTFVRGDVINADAKLAAEAKKGKLYKPKMKFPDVQETEKVVMSPVTPKLLKPDRPVLKKKDDKKKSNLELFKEELKVLQLEREQRHAVKRGRNSLGQKDDNSMSRSSRFEPLDDKVIAKLGLNLDLLDDLVLNSQENGDPMTTNLFLGNVNPRMDEQQLCELFGKYGPLASVKVMWPRTDEERARERNCAFVAFMTRKDADRALRHLQGRDVKGFEMKLGWGKTVPIPPHPVYVPPVLLERTLPPAPSGLPFNAQPNDPAKKSHQPGVPPEFVDQKDFEDTLKNSVVRVVVPTERNLLCLIHRMVEFVVREGPMFEAMIMNREINNPMFRFLFDNKSPTHIYYRWRMFSILQGGSPTNYRTEPFRLFKGGSLWKPPPINPYVGGLDETDSESEELPYHKSAKIPDIDVRRAADKDADGDKVKGELKEDDRDVLEDILRSLLPRQKAIGDAMVFCLRHSDCSEEIVDCITESLSILETPLTKKIARLYLISDILHNSSAKVANASYFRKHFEVKLEQVMKDLHACHQAISSRLRAEQFKQKVLTCFRAWDDWTIYPDKYLIHLQNTFLGLVAGGPSRKSQVEEPKSDADQAGEVADDGVYQQEDELDGVPIVEASELPVPAAADSVDVDGMPLDGDQLDGVPLEKKEESKGGAAPRFVQSKWETVDPEDVEAQAMTTSKWDQLENQNVDGEPLDSDGGGTDLSPKKEEEFQEDAKLPSEYDELKRARLREIEVKVMKFQDELESGQRKKQPGTSISHQVSQYRTKLLERESEKEDRERRSHREAEKRKEKRRVPSSDEASSSSSADRVRKKRRKKESKDSSATPRRGGGLVTYDSDGSSDDSYARKRVTASSKKKKVARPRTRSRSRDKHSSRKSPSRRSPPASSHRHAITRVASRTPPKRSSKRSRSRSRDKKKKRKSKH